MHVTSIRPFTLAVVFCTSLLWHVNAQSSDADEGAGGVPLLAAERADLQAVLDFVVRSTNSADLRLRVFSGLQPPVASSFDVFATQVPIDQLADAARGSTDPVVLAMLVEACGRETKPALRCDAREMAVRWTVADTQNQVAWLTLSNVLRWQGDAVGARVAFERGARASSWREYFDDGNRLYLNARPADLGPRGRLAVTTLGINASMVWLLPSNAGQALSFQCADDGMHDACVRITDTIDRDGGTIYSRRVGIGIAKRIGLDADRSTARTMVLDAFTSVAITDAVGPFEAASQEQVAYAATRMDEQVAAGEIPYYRERLRASGLTTQAAAGRYRAYWTARRASDKASPDQTSGSK